MRFMVIDDVLLEKMMYYYKIWGITGKYEVLLEKMTFMV